MLTLREITETSTELLVVNAARVSLSKRVTSLSTDCARLIRFLCRNCHWTPFGHPQMTLMWSMKWEAAHRLFFEAGPGSYRYLESSPRAEKCNVIERGSLWYWLENLHLYGSAAEKIGGYLRGMSPTLADAALGDGRIARADSKEPVSVGQTVVRDSWAAAEPRRRANLLSATFLVRAPIPVRTQLFKHKVGFVENEISRRYVKDAPTFHMPEVWRKRGDTIKQGSLDEPVDHPLLVKLLAKAAYFSSKICYNAALSLDVCPEQARFLLSQGMDTEWYWTAGLQDFRRVKSLRLTPHAQRETWQLAEKLHEKLGLRYPQTWAALSSSE